MNGLTKKRGKALLFFFLIISINACFEPAEGCLEVEAINFQIDADKPCVGCCNFPNLKIDFQHRIVTTDTTINFVYIDEVYTSNGVDYFRVENIQFYLSEVQLISSGGLGFTPLDTIEVSVLEDDGNEITTYIDDDFALINRSTLTPYTLGTFRRSGTYNGIQFTLGIEGVANQSIPESFPDEHPLAEENNMYWSQDSGFIFNRIAFFRDTTAADTVSTIVEIGLEENLRTVTLSFPEDLSLQPGFNPEIIVQIDYLKWFEGVDVKNDPVTEISKKIVENLTESFSVIVAQQDSE